ncbi:MAG: shikimate dehydrogenase [Coriobacteriales bacterium]|jgi:shikimate dehydrogenase|nr:shikimate dehydrogenase [Coriobacteriales bacterium]
MMRTGLLGHPIGHSLSPAIHNAAYAALGLDWEYGLYPCEDRASFERVLAEAQRVPDAFVGFNVTTPYKHDAHRLCAEHSSFSAATGSTNVIRLCPSPAQGLPVLCGDDTDGRGLVASLQREGNVTLAGSSVVLCGTGAVALSALLALVEAGTAAVSVVSRDVVQAAERIRRLMQGDVCQGDVSLDTRDTGLDRCPGLGADDGHRPPTAVQVVGYEEAARCLATADVLVDATTLGMHAGDGSPVPAQALREGLVVLDVVYGHGETALIGDARRAGAVAIDGLGMLIEQAALTIEIWARGQGLAACAPRSLMRQAALAPHA